MRLSFEDAFSSAFEAARGFRWTEYAPFFWILATQWIFLALSTQLHTGWAMSIVAPLARLAGGEAHLHYPGFFGYLSILLGWLESFLYAIPGAVLIPLALLRLYARTDRALSLGAGAASRLAGAFLPTLVSGLAGIGAIWGWQRYASPVVTSSIRGAVTGSLGGLLGWLAITLGSYVILTLLLYVPVAAVQARTNPIRAFAYGIRFGLRSWPLTLTFAILFGIPAILVQFMIERQGTLLLARLRPELVTVLLGLYAAVTSMATYFTYAAAARLYRFARGDE
ncbi:MAG: hypothetical protein AABZ94_01035 [Candidatus Eisenbacteria bacterium]